MVDHALYGYSPYAIPTAVTSILLLLLGALALKRRVSRLSISFSVVVATVTIWLIAFTLVALSRDASVALQWARIAYWGVPLIAPAIYQFAVEMLRIYPRRRLTVFAGWTVGAMFVIIATGSDLLVPNVQHYWWGFYPRYRPSLAVPFLAFFLGFLIAAAVELSHGLRTARGVERARIKLPLIGCCIAYFACVDFLPKFGVAVYPFGYLPIFGFVAISAYAFRRFDLVARVPSLPAPEIIETMAEALFVCDEEGRISMMNKAGESLLGYRVDEVVGRHISTLVDGGGELNQSEERTFLAKSGERVDLILSYAPVMQNGRRAGAILIGRDIRERKSGEQRVRESELRYRSLFERNAAGVCVTSMQGIIEDCNDTFAGMLDYQRSELIGRSLYDLYWVPGERAELDDLVKQAQTLSGVEMELRHKDGSRVAVLQNLTVAGDSFFMTVVDISDRKRAEEQIEFHAYHDVLTHLPNRKLFMDRLRQNLTHSRRAGKSLAVMFIDLDEFKAVNDTLGHAAGDELLLEIAKRLTGCVRGEDTVARLGGDEFSIVLSELRRPEDAGRVAEKIIAAVQRPVMIGSTPAGVSASIGVALYPVDGIDAESLIRNADSAMYRAKESGRNNYQLCTDDLKRRAIERLSLETRLRKAIGDEQLVLHYQPQVSLDRMKVIGVEALVRWDDPEHGLVFPGSFIPLAEESRLILPMGDWVLRTACEQMQRWREEGLDVPHVGVNLSMRQFQQQDIVDRVADALALSGIPGSALQIEITEATMLANIDTTTDVLQALHEMGVTVAIDDFGMGFSSLSYLRRFPISGIKIDRSFIRDVNTSENDASIVSAAIALARNLRLHVMAEGVENEEQLTFIRRKECEAAQGYYFSRPVPAATIADLLADNTSIMRAPPRLIV